MNQSNKLNSKTTNEINDHRRRSRSRLALELVRRRPCRTKRHNQRVVSGKAVPFDASATLKPGYSVISGNTVLGTVAQHGDVSLDATADSINGRDKGGVTTLKGHAVLTVLAAGKPVARFEAAELKLVRLK